MEIDLRRARELAEQELPRTARPKLDLIVLDDPTEEVPEPCDRPDLRARRAPGPSAL